MTPQSILIVEDMPENVLILRSLLASECETIHVAETGEEAVEMCRTLRPDLVLLDVILPGIDGYEVCRQLKADTALAQIPVIFITALDSQEKETRGLDVGGVDYIAKPYDPPITRLRVRNHLLMKAQRDLLERRTRELENALAQVKQLTGMLPICAWCKKIRDDKGYWKQIEVYIRDHSDADFSHGVCPECLEGLLDRLPAEPPPQP